MKLSRLPKGLLSAVFMALFAGLLLTGGAAHAACVDWSKARGVIAKNNLKKPGAVRKRAIRRGEEVLSIKLCKRGARYVYVMTVRGRKKDVDIVVVNAHNGSKVGSGKGLKKRILKKVRRGLRKYGL